VRPSIAPGRPKVPPHSGSSGGSFEGTVFWIENAIGASQWAAVRSVTENWAARWRRSAGGSGRLSATRAGTRSDADASG